MKYKYQISMLLSNGKTLYSESKFSFLTVDSAMKSGKAYANKLIRLGCVGTIAACVEIFNTNREQEARFEFPQI